MSHDPGKGSTYFIAEGGEIGPLRTESEFLAQIYLDEPAKDGDLFRIGGQIYVVKAVIRWIKESNHELRHIAVVAPVSNLKVDPPG